MGQTNSERLLTPERTLQETENIDALLASVFNQRDDFVNRLLKVEPVRLRLNRCDFDWSRYGCVIHPLIEEDDSGDRLKRAREEVARSPSSAQPQDDLWTLILPMVP